MHDRSFTDVNLLEEDSVGLRTCISSFKAEEPPIYITALLTAAR
jgi:hypothetical protein